MALTLIDYDTPVWLGGGGAGVADWLRFHTGCPIVAEPGAALFAIALAAWPALAALDAGSDAWPDRSATLIAQVAALHGRGLRLAGPGVDGSADFGFAPQPAGFVEAWRGNAARFPRGIDLILSDGGTVAALPRTVAIGTAE